MPRGGPRPGAGRPKKVKAAASAFPASSPEIDAAKTPLEFMIAVMQDPTIDPARRDRMAVAAAAFLHRRGDLNQAPTVEPVGKKAQQQADAVTAQEGTSWGDVLPPPGKSLQ